MNISPSSLFPVRALCLLVGGFLLVPAVSAQTILGSTARYAVMAGGTVTINGVTSTTITGDFGTSLVAGAGAYTVSGTTGPIAGQDLTDFNRAFSGLAAMTPTVDLTGKILGTDATALILTPGIYHFDSTAQLTGTLTLDAQNQSHAVWVFQIGTAFTTAADATVLFANLAPGSVANNGLFWQVGSATSFGANTTMEGNLLGGTTFVFGAGSSVNHGRVLTATGTMTIDSGDFDFIALDSGYSGGLAFSDASNAITAVPEPSTYALIAAGAALGLATWRRRRSAL